MSFVQDKIYPSMPVFIQNLMISAFGFQWQKRRFGGCYSDFLKEVKSREFYTSEQWDEYQTLELRKLLVHAYGHVKFYREKYEDAGFTETDLKNINLSDLKYIPFLEKDELRRFGTTTLLSDKLSGGLFISSSGSSGTPTKIYLPRYFHQKFTALMEGRVRNWAGVSKDTPRGMIGGRRILPDSHFKMPYYRYNYFEKQTYFSAYHISPGTVGNYLKGIIDNTVEFMTGYAISNFLLAKLISEKGLVAPQLKAVITSSEKLTPEMRKTIEEVYRCKCYDSYSGCEECGLISETPEGTMVVSPDAGIMEFLNEDGSYSTAGETGEIVSTGLNNYDQPLIRYRIGDMARLSSDQSPVGGRYMVRVDEITGRIEDLIVCRDGRSMVRFHSLYLDIPGLKTGQLIQHDYERFTLNLLIDKQMYKHASAEALLKKRLESQLGPTVINFNYPDKIATNSNGKIKAVISELKENWY
jgi:phenylacetate-CoA ligase